MDLIQLIGLGTIATVFTGGAAWGAVKVTLNGTKARVEKLEAHSIETTDRLARIETKVDQLLRKN